MLQHPKMCCSWLALKMMEFSLLNELCGQDGRPWMANMWVRVLLLLTWLYALWRPSEQLWLTKLCSLSICINYANSTQSLHRLRKRLCHRTSLKSWWWVQLTTLRNLFQFVFICGNFTQTTHESLVVRRAELPQEPIWVCAYLWEFYTNYTWILGGEESWATSGTYLGLCLFVRFWVFKMCRVISGWASTCDSAHWWSLYRVGLAGSVLDCQYHDLTPHSVKLFWYLRNQVPLPCHIDAECWDGVMTCINFISKRGGQLAFWPVWTLGLWNENKVKVVCTQNTPLWSI